MMHIRKLTEDETLELHLMAGRETKRVRRRAQMVLLSAEGEGVSQIALRLKVTRVTVRFWLRRYSAGGASALYDDARMGRPRKQRPEGTLNSFPEPETQNIDYAARV